MIEEWKDIEGFNGYQVSNLGRIKSKVKQVNVGASYKRTLPEKILKPIIKSYGQRKDHYRYVVNLYYDTGRYKSKQISRLVAKAFINEYNEDMLVMHKDNNPLNNTVYNLKIGTYTENNQQAWDDNRQPKR
jgi:hypothetical protein